MNRYLLAVAAHFFCFSTDRGAGHHEKKVNATPEWQIEAYSSAAPDFIGDFATIIGSGWHCAERGQQWLDLPIREPTYGAKDGLEFRAHQAMPVCHDDEGMKWMMAFMQGKKPDMERDSSMWMLHGDVGEDNTTPAVMNKGDSKPGHWIESGPHLMLMPKRPYVLGKLLIDFTTGARTSCLLAQICI